MSLFRYFECYISFPKVILRLVNSERREGKGMGVLARYNHSLTKIEPAANHIALASTTDATASEGSTSGP